MGIFKVNYVKKAISYFKLKYRYKLFVRAILINKNMQSISSPVVYAAGDCCACHNWPKDETENWFQVFVLMEILDLVLNGVPG